MENIRQTYSKGLAYAIASYGVWGLFPLYWKMISYVPSEQILAHRIAWSCIFLLIMAIFRKDKTFIRYFSNPKIAFTLLLTAVLIALNWGVYIYAINHDHIVDSSLGYYINPMINVLLGIVFLKERLSKIQIIAVVFALAGIAWLTISVGRLPVISLILAFSFGFYGLIRKKINLQSMPGLTVETVVLMPVALWFLWHVNNQGTGAFMHVSRFTDLILILGGPVTAIPLFWFGAATTRIPLSTIGFIQYMSPTLQLILGLFVFHENFTNAYLISFCLVWIGLAIYSYSIVKEVKKRKNVITA